MLSLREQDVICFVNQCFKRNLYSEFLKEVFYMFNTFLILAKLLSNNQIICLWWISANILNKVFHLFTHIEIDMCVGIHTYLHMRLINEFLYLQIQKLTIYASSCHGINKASFPPVFTALQLRSNFDCLGWDKGPLPCLNPKVFSFFMYKCAQSLIEVALSCRYSHTAHGDPTGYLREPYSQLCPFS